MIPHTLCTVCGCVTWRTASRICRSCIAMRRIAGEPPMLPYELRWADTADIDAAPQVERRGRR